MAATTKELFRSCSYFSSEVLLALRSLGGVVGPDFRADAHLFSDTPIAGSPTPEIAGLFL